MTTGSPADRELRAEITVEASPERVWEVLADVRGMPRWSPELAALVPLRRGGLRRGQQYLGINRRGPVVWPTRSVVAEVEPGRRLAWDTLSSGARWIWELEPTSDGGTRVVQRRPVPTRLTRASHVFASTFLGGAQGHADELEAGMVITLERFRSAVRAASAGA